MTIKNKVLAGIIGTLLVAVMIIAGVFIVGSTRTAQGSAPIGLISMVATSSTIAVGPSSVVTVFSPNQVCDARIISTGGQAIMLSFSADLTPAAFVGHVQAASTTVAYDGGLYGCGTTTAYGFVSSTTITKTETR